MEQLFDSASSVMTVVSFITFISIVAWACARRNQPGFAQAAQLPFEEEEDSHV